MDEVEPVVTRARPQTIDQARAADDWIPRLLGDQATRAEATRQLHELMLRASRHHIGRMLAADDLGWVRREEVVHAAADEATAAVLARLSQFEGRSRFTTWAYKFAILQTAVEVRRLAWRHREIDLEAVDDPVSPAATPEAYAEHDDLSHAVSDAMGRVLTAHQRQVAFVLLVEGVPVDVLAERLGSNRNAIYKTLHDARGRLRADLIARGYLSVTTSTEATP